MKARHDPETHEIGGWGDCLEDDCDFGEDGAYWNKVEAGLIDAEADAAVYHARTSASSPYH